MAAKIGFIGLGTMGKPMARHLLKAGYDLTVYNRSRPPVDELAAEGAKAAESASGAAASADFIITMLPDSPDVDLVVREIEQVIQTGQTVIDMSTISPSVARTIAARLQESEVSFLDAPVSGGEKGAVEATLSIMVGGEEETYQRALPILQVLGKNIVYMGPSGSGQATKLCNQVICGLNILAVCEGLTLGAKSGLDLEKLLSAISSGAAGSWMLSNLAPKMVQRDWRPGFKINLQQKDLRLALESAAEINLPLLGTSLVQQVLRIAQTAGAGEEGTQAAIKALETIGRMGTPSIGMEKPLP